MSITTCQCTRTQSFIHIRLARCLGVPTVQGAVESVAPGVWRRITLSLLVLFVFLFMFFQVLSGCNCHVHCLLFKVHRRHSVCPCQHWLHPRTWAPFDWNLWLLGLLWICSSYWWGRWCCQRLCCGFCLRLCFVLCLRLCFSLWFCWWLCSRCLSFWRVRLGWCWWWCWWWCDIRWIRTLWGILKPNPPPDSWGTGTIPGIPRLVRSRASS